MWWRPTDAPRLRRLRQLAAALAAPVVAWVVLLKVDPPPDPYATRPPSPQVLARDDTLLRAYCSADEKWRLRLVGREEKSQPPGPVAATSFAGVATSRGSGFAAAATSGGGALAAVSPHLVAAVLEHEDRWFFRHPGVNPVSLARAAWTNAASGRVVSGASTITMQLVRLGSPRPRSLRYKLWQIYRALQSECLHSKADILAVYLDLAPYGGNVEGVEAASWLYFGKPARALSVGESALLAVIPQSPARHHPLRRPEQARTARDRLIRRMERRGRIDAASAAEALALPLPTRAQAPPFMAPHFADWILREEPLPASGAYRTTLDAGIQRACESLVHRRVRDLAPGGITQGAAVVVDYASSELVALVGSADFFDAEHAGQVNGALAPRSPGSTLKPFVYALAVDRGLITADMRIEDVPMHLGSYEPENFDREYRGAISAAEALRSSRNVPAVRLAHRLGQSGGRDLYDLLLEGGVRSLRRPREHYGLSLVLGGGDVTLLELCGLYAALARHGRPAPLTVRRDVQPPPTGGHLFSAEAASIVLDILVDVTRPEEGAVWRSGRRQFPVPWKTGTSFGRRDAWSVGVAGRYVVGIWLGNFDGVGVPALAGVEVAAPLLFDVVAALPHDEAGSWHEPAPKLRKREICATSGMPRGPHCPHGEWGSYIPGISPAPPCTVHREIEVDVRTGFAVCARCRDDRRTARRVVEWWPDTVAQHLRANRLADGAVPPHNPACRALEPGSDPRITSPLEDVLYYVRPGTPPEDQRIALTAAVSRGIHEVYWFLDGTLVWKGPPDRSVFVEPGEGLHQVCVKDDRGRSASRALRVKVL